MSKPQPSLDDDLIGLHDEVVCVTQVNAFLSNAFVLSLTEHDWLDPEIIAGARRCCNWQLQQNSQLAARMQQVVERYTAEHPAAKAGS
jgi:hypothetical protein